MEPLLQSSTPSTWPISATGWRGFGRGLIPLAILTGCVLLTLALTLGVEQLTSGVGFAVREWLVAGVFVIGLAMAAVAYVVALVRIFRRWRVEQREKDDASATGMLWALIVTAIVVALPVVVVALIPQHPAP